MWAGKTYWLVGASEGLGRALATELDRLGARLVLSARSADRLEDLAGELRGAPRVVACDVTDEASVARAWGEVGEVDGIVYLAGLYEPMTAREWSAEKVLAITDVNFTGAVRVLGHVVPAFVARGWGHITLVGSLAGYRGLPGAIGYGASKAALMHLAENLQADLWRSHVRVQLMNPGFVRTRLTEKNDFAMPYLMEPDEAARIMREAMERRAFKRDFPWRFSLVFRLSRFAPLWLYNRVFARG